MSDLANRSVIALAWNYGGNAGRAVLQLSIGIVLARILGPEPFGLVAIAWLVIGFGRLFGDFGLSAAIIQKPVISPGDIGFTFTIQLLAGATLTVAGFVFAGEIAQFFRRPDAAVVIKALAPIFIIQSLGQTTTALLQRDLRFRQVQIANLSSFVCGYVIVGIPLALRECSVWSLVFAQLTQAVAYLLGVFILSGYPIVRPALKPSTRGLSEFGGKIFLASVLSWCISSLDSLIVGRVFGVGALGFYDRAKTLASTPTAIITTSIQSILFSATSRSREKNKVAVAFLGLTTLLGSAAGPVFGAISASSGTVIEVLYGEAWLPASGILSALAASSFAYILLALAGPILSAFNEVNKELRAQLLLVLMMVAAGPVASEFTLTQVAWGVCSISVLRLVLLTIAVCRLLNIGAARVYQAYVPPICLTALTTSAAYFIESGMSDYSLMLRVIAHMCTFITFVATSVWVFRGFVFDGPHGELICRTHRGAELAKRVRSVA